MSRITARFNGKCAGSCGKPTLQGSTIEYDYESKKVWHPECAPGVGNPKETFNQPDESASKLADRLLFATADEVERKVHEWINNEVEAGPY